eukprot:1159185-Pelagomonas_calceolata.AAC.9
MPTHTTRPDIRTVCMHQGLVAKQARARQQPSCTTVTHNPCTTDTHTHTLMCVGGGQGQAATVMHCYAQLPRTNHAQHSRTLACGKGGQRQATTASQTVVHNYDAQLMYN